MFYTVSAGVFLYYLHGIDAVWPLLIASANFSIAKLLGKSILNPVCTWAFNIIFLVVTDQFDFPLVSFLLLLVFK